MDRREKDRRRDPDVDRPSGRRLRPDVSREGRRDVAGGAGRRLLTRLAPRSGRSSPLLRRARPLRPGGGASPVRSSASVDGEPFSVTSGRGARLRDADGRARLDYVMSYGPLLFGHAPAFVVREVAKAARGGTSFGAPTEREVRLAERVTKMVPSVEMIRFVSSGT